MATFITATTRRRRRDAGYSPLSLFQAGEQGGWWDPSDPSTLFQDAAGTIPVTALGQPVGFALDKSQGLVRGPERVVGGDMQGGLIGTKSDGGGSVSTYTLNTVDPISGTQDARLVITTPSASFFPRILVIPSPAAKVVGRLYQVSFDYKVNSGAPIVGLLFNGFGTTNNMNSQLTGSGRWSAFYVAAGVNTNEGIYFGNAVGDIQITNISCREVPGNHLTQGTDTARPRWDARANLLVGTTTMATQNVTTLATPYTLSFTGTGTVTLSGTSTAGPLVGTGVGQRVSLTFTPTAGTLTLTVSGTVTDAQLEFGSAVTQYQRVTTATDYADIGLPRRLRHDGLDDFVRTPVGADIAWGSDAVTLCVGANKLSDAAQGMLAEFSASVAGNNGTFNLQAPSATPGTNRYAYESNGTATATANATAAGFAAPHLSVQTLLADISADTLAGRVNGVEVITSATDQGTGNFGTYPLFIGRRGGTTLPYNGEWGQIIAVNRQLTASELAQLERFVASRTGVTLP